MANDLTQVAEYLVTAGVAALRQNSITARLVNADFQNEAAQPNQFIRVPLPSPVSVVTVTPGTFQSGTDLAPTGVDVKLDQWRMAGFQLSDKEQAEVTLGRVLPLGVQEAVKALANDVDSYILGKLYKRSFTEQASSNPTVLTDLTAVRKGMNVNLCPLDSRRFVMGPAVEEELLRIAEFTNYDKVNESAPLIEGRIGRRFGIDLYMDQNAPTHTKGTGASYVANGAHSAGVKDVVIKTGSGTVVEGDIVTFAGHTQTYVVTTGVAAPGTISIYPALKANVADGAAVTIGNGGVKNVAFHRDAMVFATRPLSIDAAPGVIMAQASDPISGLSLRVERIRSAKQSYWQFDVLYGGAVVRPEFIATLRS